MVDRAIFTNMGGAKAALRSLGVIANNLANANTTGFHADHERSISKTTNANALQTRINSVLNNTYSDFTPGPTVYTGRELDIAIEGSGFIAVQTKDGQEAYTRAGNLEITENGVLVTSRGDLVLGDGGVVTIPPSARITIDKKGIVSALLLGEGVKTIATIDQIKLVDIPTNVLNKGADGLFYANAGTSAGKSDKISIIPESLEGSNVDPVKTLTELIDLSRQFEVHTKLMKSVEDNATTANQLLEIPR